MIFADHLQGLDNRIELKNIKLWNVKTADAGATYPDHVGLTVYDQDDGHIHSFLEDSGGGGSWRALLDERLASEKVWLGVGGVATETQLVKPGETVGVDGIRLDQLDEPAGSVSLGNQRIINLEPVPSADTDAASKAYVDNQVKSGGERQLPAARVATTTDLGGTYDNVTNKGTITATTNVDLPLIDNVDLNLNEHVLVKNQGTTNPGESSSKSVENGLYVVTTKSPKWVLTRHEEMNEDNGVTATTPVAGKINELHNVAIVVQEGDTHSNSSWRQIAPFPVKGTTPIEWVITSTNTTYKQGLGIKIDTDNKINFFDTVYKPGSLFAADTSTTMLQIEAGSSIGTFLQNVGARWQKSAWSVPRTISTYSVLVSDGDPLVTKALSAQENTVLVRDGSNNLSFAKKLPSAILDLTTLFPVALDQGGTGVDMTTDSVVHSDVPNVRHGVVFMDDKAAPPRKLTATNGPPWDTNSILMHKGAPAGASTPGVGEQGRAAWQWVDLWSQDNTFTGQLTIGPANDLWTMCHPGLILENYSKTAYSGIASSPSVQWRGKYVDGTSKWIGWSAACRMDSGASNPSEWLLGTCVFGSVTLSDKLSVQDNGLLKSSQALSTSETTFHAIALGAGTIGYDKFGQASLRFSHKATAGQHSTVGWFTEAGGLGITGSGATKLFWRGEFIDGAHGGFGMDVAKDAFKKNRLIYKVDTDSWGVIEGAVKYSPLLNLTDTDSAPFFAPYALPASLHPDDTGGMLTVLGTTSVGVTRVARTETDVDNNGPGVSRKYIKTVQSSTKNITVTHGLNTREVVVSVRTNPAAGTVPEQVYFGVDVTSDTVITLVRAHQSSDSYVVTVIG